MVSDTTSAYPFVDVALARRLERTEGRASAAFVKSRARLDPERGASWTTIAGAYAMFDGIGSPLTQTFGLGLFEPATESALEALEQFFEVRGANVDHEVSPLAEASTLEVLTRRGYAPIELTSVMFRPLTIEQSLTLTVPGRIRVTVVTPGHEQIWTDTAARGWSEQQGVADFMLDLGRVSVRSEGNVCFLAHLDDAPVAAGGLAIHDRTALLAGASTVPGARRQGAQQALLDHRLRYAVEHGCDLAMMCASPGSPSQRNAERHGFRIAYTRIKWRRGSAASAISGA